MKFKFGNSLVALRLLAALALTLQLSAQSNLGEHRHHHYKLIDLGTLGGPNSLVTFPETNTITAHGTVIGSADTSTSDPYAPNCLQDCLVNHSFLWRGGIQSDLGALPGVNNSIPEWINSRGWVVGASENGDIDPLTGVPEMDAVLWRDGQIVNLGTLGGNASVANAVNNHGQVVGGALNTVGDPFSATFTKFFTPFTPPLLFFPVATQARAFLWQDGVMQDLGTLGGPDSVSWFVNDRGQVVGQSSVNDNPNPTTGVPTVDPFFWEDGKMMDMGSLGGDFGWPFALNNRGDVVGTMFLPGDSAFHPFLWRHKVLKDLGTLGGDFGIANTINDRGEVVGWAFNQGNTAVFASSWKNGHIANLGTVDGDPCSVANGINGGGQIVGDSSPSCFSSNANHAVLWENDLPGVDLNTLIHPDAGMQLAVAFSINDRGEIDGNGLLPNGNQHAFLLIPCDDNHSDFESCDHTVVDVLEHQPAPRIMQTVPSLGKRDILDGLRSRQFNRMAFRFRASSDGSPNH